MHKKIAIQSSGELARKLCRHIVGQIDPNNFTQEEIFGIHLAIEEAMINAVEHGNRLDTAKTVTIEYSISPDVFDISIEDEGCGFKPDSVPDPREDENLYNIGGRGLLLMRASMDSVEYNEKGNCVRLVKRAANTKKT